VKNLKVGASSLYLIGKPFKELERAIRNLNIKYWEIVDEDTLRLNERRARVLNELKKTFNLEYTVHAPFADINIATFNSEIKRVVMRRLTQSMNYASCIEAKFWVFHPGLHSGLSGLHPNKDWSLNVKSVKALSKAAENLGIKILVENMPDPFPFLLKRAEDFDRFYSAIQEDAPKIAFDIGHANTLSQTTDFLDKYGSKIAHIHAHDNRGSFDDHLPVGEGTVNWRALKSKLLELNYSGHIIAESVAGVPESVQKLKDLLARSLNFNAH
jgi:sugar phosphate isomerase/epimerase